MQFRKGVAAIPGFARSLAMLSLVSVGFFVVGAIENHSLVFWFLVWNLFLAWLPLLFVLWLLPVIKRYGWTSWSGILLTLLWINFLPNSFYMVSDFIHLQDYQRVRAGQVIAMPVLGWLSGQIWADCPFVHSCLECSRLW